PARACASSSCRGPNATPTRVRGEERPIPSDYVHDIDEGGTAGRGSGQNHPMTTTSGSQETAGPEPEPREATPFRFYDNRQKYLAFITTCNEKQVIAAKAAGQIAQL